MAPRTASVQPFHSLLYRDLDQDLVLPLARNFAEAVVLAVKHSVRLDAWLAFTAPIARMRVGYISHDFGDHPTGHLFNSVPGLHTQAEAFYFSLSGAEGSRYATTFQTYATTRQTYAIPMPQPSRPQGTPTQVLEASRGGRGRPQGV